MKKTTLLFSSLLLVQGLTGQCYLQPYCQTLPLTICDSTDNAAEFWNNPAFYDLATGTHDLGEGQGELSLQVLNTCDSGELKISFVLLLDLDGDDIRETAVTGTSVPGTDSVYFGNATQPGYAGGLACAFDLRPVPANQKYRFVVEKTVQGNIVTARVRWTTAQLPNAYMPVQLPYGIHRILWRVEKNGELKTCELGYIFVKDCQPPSIVCQTGLAVNIPSTHYLQLPFSALVQSVADNFSSTSQMLYGLRRSGEGSGFPIPPIDIINFTCNELGPQPIELWAKDLAGNASHCETTVIIQDNNAYCLPVSVTMDVCVFDHCDQSGLSDVQFSLFSTAFSGPYPLGSSDINGCIPTSHLSIANGQLFSFYANKFDDPLRGLSTYDLILITRHLLGLQALTSSYQLLAADADGGEVITALDVKALREIILGKSGLFPNNNAIWHFVKNGYVFADPADTLPQLDTAQPYISKQLYGVKTGDVDCSASHPPGPAPEAFITLPNLPLQANETVEVPVRFLQTEELLGFQFGLAIDPDLLELVEVIPELDSLDNFGIFSDQVNVSWLNGGLPATLAPDQPVYRLRIKALAPLQLAEVIHLDTAFLAGEAYLANDSLVRLRLQFTAPVGTEEAGAALQIFAPQPNPTTAGVRFPLQLEQSGMVTVEILDGMGRLIFRREQAGTAGLQGLEIPASAFPQAGAYAWRVQAGTECRVGKIIRQ